MDSPRVQLIRRLFELMETNSLARASEELLAHCAEDVVFEPHAAHGRLIRGPDELRRFWESFEEEGVQMRAGAYSVTEDGRLADTQSRWVYRFNDDDQVVSARVERA